MEAPSGQDSFVDSPLCVSGPRLVRSGFKPSDYGDDFVMFVNAGGCEILAQDSSISCRSDSCFEGGDVIATNEAISGGGDYPSVYQSARYGNFCYKLDSLSPGDYFVDFHFAEIVNTNGPKGIRVFDVFVQDEKILSEFDIYAIVGANKPLQVVDVRASVDRNESIVIRFERNSGTPTVCGICIRRAPKLAVESSTTLNVKHQIGDKCATEIEVSPVQSRAQGVKFIAKYEKKIEDLTSQCKLKSDECYEAWMLLSDANQELEKLKMEHENKLFRAESLEQIVDQQAQKLRDISERCGCDKKMWADAINHLEGKIKLMKQEQAQLSQDAHECANSIPDMDKMIGAVQSLVTMCDNLKMKYSEEMAKGKKLFNQLQETKGNIRVFCRCRPLSKEEVSAGYTMVADFEAAKDGELGIVTGGSTKKTFKFDRVYSPKDNQADVYADASPLVVSVLDGYNVCIFAYGQTGTGKTFTMEGIEQDRGVNYRTLEELFKISGERKDTHTYSISVSVLEVYNEQIRDLLATSPSSKKLEVRQAAEGSHHVPGIVEAKVESTKEVWDVLQAGSNARAVGSNNVNEHSSRSHCMLCIMVKAKNLMNGECTNSKLWLVDLAGSERLAKTDVQGERLKEAQNINRSLSALGDVISALATRNSHIPYRNSKLTHLLQDSLGGDSKALMFVQVSPSENDLGETMSSLNFASRVRGIELGPARKQVDTGELQKTKQLLDKVRQESRIKDESFRKLEENYQNLENKFRGKDQLCKNLLEKNKELEGQLESKLELQSVSEKQHWQLAEKLKGKEETCVALQQKVKELEHKLKDQQHSESIALQNKVKELEHKLKDQQHSESIALQNKVKELEHKLKDQQHSDSIALQNKVKELECKLKEQMHSESVAVQKVKELEVEHKECQHSESMLEQKVKELEEKKLRQGNEHSDALRVGTPTVGKGCTGDESISETESRILRSSNSINRPMVGQGSVHQKGAESLHEIKRKREPENGHGMPTASVEKKTELNRIRRTDATKAFSGRVSRGPRVVAVQKITRSRTNKEQQQQQQQQQQEGVKEKERLRVWAR